MLDPADDELTCVHTVPKGVPLWIGVRNRWGCQHTIEKRTKMLTNTPRRETHTQTAVKKDGNDGYEGHSLPRTTDTTRRNLCTNDGQHNETQHITTRRDATATTELSPSNLLHVPSSNCRQRASRKSVTGLNSHMMGLPAYHLPMRPLRAESASSSSRNCSNNNNDGNTQQ